jgi:hypothetical protein
LASKRSCTDRSAGVFGGTNWFSYFSFDLDLYTLDERMTPLVELQGEQMTDNSSLVPNMAQRSLMQYLSIDDWNIAAHLPIPAGELMLSRMREFGWIESRGEKHKMAIRLTPAGLKAMRSPIV